MNTESRKFYLQYFVTYCLKQNLPYLDISKLKNTKLQQNLAKGKNKQKKRVYITINDKKNEGKREFYKREFMIINMMKETKTE